MFILQSLVRGKRILTNYAQVLDHPLAQPVCFVNKVATPDLVSITLVAPLTVSMITDTDHYKCSDTQITWI